MKVIGQRRVKARKPHGCFLCTFPIDKGEEHEVWACVDPGVRIVRVRAHDGCREYAHDNIDDWTNGDGVEDNAVETYLRDALVYGRADSPVWDETEANRIAVHYPGLVKVLAKVRADAGLE